MIVLAIFLILFGLFMLFRPAVFWTITESWKSNDATEPSDIYLLSTRIGGSMLILAGTGSLTVYSLL